LISNFHVHGSLERLRRLCALVVLLSSCAVISHAQQPATKMRLAKVEVTGLRRVKEEDVVAASGLQIGQALEVEMLDAAAQRLLASGLVSKLGYKMRERAGEAIVTFEVTEAEHGTGLPVVFDNFVWFTPEEIAAAVRRDVPAFDGTAPDSGTVIEGIRKSLERLLAERKIAGQVEYLPSMKLETGGDRKHVFTVTGVKLPVCAAHFPGASGVAEQELIASAQTTVFGNDYSREFVWNFADVALRDLYHERGYLRVEFGEPRGALGADASCGTGGVSVTLPVREGIAYNWGSAQWTGNAALSPAELDAALGMKPGELANGKKIEKAVASVSRAYGRKGYLAVGLKPSPEFADEARSVTYRFEVSEGAQYHMGALNIVGLPDADIERLKAKWKLQPGDVYDAGYIQEFVRDAMRELVKPGGKPLRLGTEVNPNPAKLTADVTITFKQG
jgi:outer membrane protein assembly factor BamA